MKFSPIITIIILLYFQQKQKQQHKLKHFVTGLKDFSIILIKLYNDLKNKTFCKR